MSEILEKISNLIRNHCRNLLTACRPNFANIFFDVVSCNPHLQSSYEMLDAMERVICFLKNFHHPYSSWILGNLDHYNFKDILLDELYQELKYGQAKEDLPEMLKHKLKKLPRSERKELISRVKDGCPVLFIACRKGNLDAVRFLIENCDADPEQIGIYEVVDEQTVHRVSPLWAAAVSGNLEVVRYLVCEAKVNINSCSDSGSTVIRSCCYMLHYDIVKFLIENGADISKSNEYGGNCLMNSVTSYQLCKLLLENGADVNAYDLQNKTALHYSIHEHNFEVTVLLLDHGADPTIEAENGEDALCSACLKMEIDTFNHLIGNVCYSVERISDAYELMGCSILDEHDVNEALEYWYKALYNRKIYQPHIIGKQNLVPPKKVYQYVTEFQTIEELDSISNDIDLIRIHSLLIFERILGTKNKNTIFRLMDHSALQFDNSQFRRYFDLWIYALRLLFEKDTIFDSESGFAAEELVCRFLDLSNCSNVESKDQMLQFDDVLETIELFYDQFDFAIRALQIRPVFKRHLEYFDEILKMFVNLLHVLNKICQTDQHRSQLYRLVVKLIEFDPRTSQGDSLLHLVVSSSTTIKSSPDSRKEKVFPNYDLTSVFLKCGASPNTTNKLKNAPLHLACTRSNYDKNIVDLLLDNGAHLDQPNFNGNQPLKQLLSIKESRIKPMKYISLKCLAAQRLNQIYSTHKEFRNREASFLEEFVNIH